MRKKTRQAKRWAIQEELLKNFEGDFYQEKQMSDGSWLVKMWSGNIEKWIVARFKKDSFKRYKSFTKTSDFKQAIETDDMREAKAEVKKGLEKIYGIKGLS